MNVSRGGVVLGTVIMLGSAVMMGVESVPQNGRNVETF
jgi:hypothetical protein